MYALLGLLLLFTAWAQAQTTEEAIDNDNVCATEIFIGENAEFFTGENATFFSVFAVAGNVLIVHTAYDVQTRYIVSEQTSFIATATAGMDFKSTTQMQRANKPVKRSNKNKHPYKGTVYSPLLPFGNAALNNGVTTASATVPSHNNNRQTRNLLTKQNNSFCFVGYFYISQYLEINTAFFTSNHNFACAAGNLSPPEYQEFVL